MQTDEFYSIYQSWQQKQLSDANTAALFFIWGQSLKNYSKNIKEDWQDLSESYLTPNCQEKILTCLTRRQFRNIKKKALTALTIWLKQTNDSWSMTLVNHQPSPIEVLNHQAMGVRPVSLIYPTIINQPVGHKEDTFSFMVHDLEHAYMFFQDSELYSLQKKFFSRLKTEIQNQHWRPIEESAKFSERFYYVMSDMNSHPSHCKKYLSALLVDYYLDQLKLSPEDELPEAIKEKARLMLEPIFI